VILFQDISNAVLILASKVEIKAGDKVQFRGNSNAVMLLRKHIDIQVNNAHKPFSLAL
jgi:hypothetical protein